jgi:hypothetical protein
MVGSSATGSVVSVDGSDRRGSSVARSGRPFVVLRRWSLPLRGGCNVPDAKVAIEQWRARIMPVGPRQVVVRLGGRRTRGGLPRPSSVRGWGDGSRPTGDTARVAARCRLARMDRSAATRLTLGWRPTGLPVRRTTAMLTGHDWPARAPAQASDIHRGCRAGRARGVACGGPRATRYLDRRLRSSRHRAPGASADSARHRARARRVRCGVRR